MNPLRLTARSYRTFPELDLDLPEGCVAVLGENGAGKSSLVDAIDVCLFGPQSRSLADLHAEDATDDLLLELEFEHAGETYRVRRTYSARGRGKSTVDLERFVDSDPVEDNWEPLTRESVKQTQERLEEILGLSRETFTASAFLRQGDGAAFTEAQPRDRKRILGDVLGLDSYDRLRERAGSDKRAAERALAELEGREAQARATADTRPDVIRSLEAAKDAEVDAGDEVADREREHQELAERWQKARELQETRRAHEAELQTARQARDQLDVLNTAANEAVAAQQVTRDELDTLATPGQLAEIEAELERLQATEDEWRRLVADREKIAAAAREATARRDVIEQRLHQAEARAEELRMKASMLDARPLDDGARCEHCGQLLDLEARDRALASYRAEADGFDRDAAAFREDLAAVTVPEVPSEIPVPTIDGIHIEDAKLAASRTATQRSVDQQQRGRLEERLVALAKTIEGRPATDDLLEADREVLARERMLDTLGDPVDIAAITNAGVDAKRTLDVARFTLAAAQNDRARCEERLAHVAAAEAQLLATASDRKQLDDELTLCDALERAYSPDGIPALIVENAAIPQIETDANRILRDLGTSYRVELRTQAELKSGDGVRDTLDVVVATDTGERPYETFSGGERTRLNLALRIALARLLAHRRGADSRLLVIDEPEYLDEAGTAALVDVLRSLQDDFDRCYLISHVPSLRDSFDDVLTVVKDPDGRSRVEEAGVFEQVPA